MRKAIRQDLQLLAYAMFARARFQDGQIVSMADGKCVVLTDGDTWISWASRFLHTRQCFDMLVLAALAVAVLQQTHAAHPPNRVMGALFLP